MANTICVSWKVINHNYTTHHLAYAGADECLCGAVIPEFAEKVAYDEMKICQRCRCLHHKHAHHAEKVAVKFSTIEDEMMGFAQYLAARNAGEVVLMEQDELVGELCEEIVKGLRYYADKDLTDDQLKAVLRKMMDNRIAELRYRHYVTHRAALIGAASLCDDDAEFITSDDITPDQAYASMEYVDGVRAALSDTAAKVFDALVHGTSEKLGVLVWLSCVRANTVHANSKAVLKYWHVAQALDMDERTVRDAFNEIRAVMVYDTPMVSNQIEYT